MERELKVQLKVFDKLWSEYEHKYISELMTIEEKARRPVSRAIEAVMQLKREEKREIECGKVVTGGQSKQSIQFKKKLVDCFREMNSVANLEGKGRDDLGVDILIEAERVLTQISSAESITLRKLAKNITQIFGQLKSLMMTYATNIEVVDPQLKNNEVEVYVYISHTQIIFLIEINKI